jgi:hypothetical protein
MKLISNRGNTKGVNSELENTQPYIQEAINKGYDVKIDIWVKDGKLHLGTDEPKTPLDIDWLERNHTKLWLQCRNIEVISKFTELDSRGGNIHFFWHDGNQISLTNRGYMWCESGEVVPGGIVYQPVESDIIEGFYGVCSDNIEIYK